MRSFLLFSVLLVACASGEGDSGVDPGLGGAGGAESSGGSAGVKDNPGGFGGESLGGTGGTVAGGHGGVAGSESAGQGGSAQGGEAGVGGSTTAGAGGGDAGMGGSTTAGAGGSTTAGAGGSVQGGSAGSGGDPFGGSGAGGGPEAKCETAQQFSVAPGQPVEMKGSTAGWTNYLGAYCDSKGASGKDAVYKVTPTVSGVVVIHLAANGSNYDPVLSVTQDACTVFVTNKDGICANYSGEGGAEKLEIKAKKDTPFWVYVDGVKGFDGEFTLTLEYEGSGVGGSGGAGGQSGEAGQGGIPGSSGQAGEGGSSGSSGQAGSGGFPEPVVGGQSCDDPILVQVGKKEPKVMVGSTGKDKNNFLGYCNIKGDQQDRVFEVTALEGGQLIAKLEPLTDELDVALYAHKDTCSSVLMASDTNKGMGDCKETFGPGAAETLNPIVVTEGSKTYVYVDTNGTQGVKGGPYRLTLTLQ